MHLHATTCSSTSSSHIAEVTNTLVFYKLFPLSLRQLATLLHLRATLQHFGTILTEVRSSYTIYIDQWRLFDSLYKFFPSKDDKYKLSKWIYSTIVNLQVLAHFDSLFIFLHQVFWILNNLIRHASFVPNLADHIIDLCLSLISCRLIFQNILWTLFLRLLLSKLLSHVFKIISISWCVSLSQSLGLTNSING